ncbi:MAG: hypothetical protein V4580_05495 [Bacteroidota bacterium]
MKKLTYLFLFLLPSVTNFAQDDVNFFYGDTVIEFNQMKFEFKGIMAYKDKFKSPLYITNFTDSFKIISPGNFTLTKEDGSTYSLSNKADFIIPPKASKRFRILYDGSDFKTRKLTLTISNIQTSINVVTVYSVKEFILDKALYKQLDENLTQTNTVGSLTVTIKNFEYKEKGTVSVTLKIKYSDQDFLAIFAKKIKLIDINGKEYINHKTGPIYYRKEKKETNLVLEFENPYGRTRECKSDRLVLDDVFVLYKLGQIKEKLSFTVLKKSEGFGNPPKEEKEKDIEVIED